MTIRALTGFSSFPFSNTIKMAADGSGGHIAPGTSARELKVEERAGDLPQGGDPDARYVKIQRPGGGRKKVPPDQHVVNFERAVKAGLSREKAGGAKQKSPSTDLSDVFMGMVTLPGTSTRFRLIVQPEDRTRLVPALHALNKTCQAGGLSLTPLAPSLQIKAGDVRTLPETSGIDYSSLSPKDLINLMSYVNALLTIALDNQLMVGLQLSLDSLFLELRVREHRVMTKLDAPLDSAAQRQFDSLKRDLLAGYKRMQKNQKLADNICHRYFFDFDLSEDRSTYSLPVSHLKGELLEAQEYLTNADRAVLFNQGVALSEVLQVHHTTVPELGETALREVVYGRYVNVKSAAQKRARAKRGRGKRSKGAFSLKKPPEKRWKLMSLMMLPQAELKNQDQFRFAVNGAQFNTSNYDASQQGLYTVPVPETGVSITVAIPKEVIQKQKFFDVFESYALQQLSEILYPPKGNVRKRLFKVTDDYVDFNAFDPDDLRELDIEQLLWAFDTLLAVMMTYYKIDPPLFLWANGLFSTVNSVLEEKQAQETDPKMMEKIWERKIRYQIVYSANRQTRCPGAAAFVDKEPEMRMDYNQVYAYVARLQAGGK